MTCSKTRESMLQHRIPISAHHLVVTGKRLDDQPSDPCKRVKKETAWFGSNQVHQQTSIEYRQPTPAQVSSIATVASHRAYFPGGGLEQKGSSIRCSFTYDLGILFEETMALIPAMMPLHSILRHTSHMPGATSWFCHRLQPIHRSRIA